MTEAVTFSSTTPRLGLPMLYSGQAQKEVFVNEAHSLIDALLHCAVSGTQAVAPTSPAEGDSGLLAPAPAAIGQDRMARSPCANPAIGFCRAARWNAGVQPQHQPVYALSIGVALRLGGRPRDGWNGGG
jgi:hypothetical protein